MKPNRLKPHNTDFNNVMILAFNSGSSKHKIHSEDSQKQMEETEIEKKPCIWQQVLRGLR